MYGKNKSFIEKFVFIHPTTFPHWDKVKSSLLFVAHTTSIHSNTHACLIEWMAKPRGCLSAIQNLAFINNVYMDTVVSKVHIVDYSSFYFITINVEAHAC